MQTKTWEARHVGLVRAVDIDRQPPDIVEVQDRDSGGLQAPGALVGAGDHAFEVAPVGGDEVYEVVHRAAGADAHDLVSFQPGKGGPCGATLVFRGFGPHGLPA